MKISREIKTGIIVVLGIALFIFGFSYLKSSPLFEGENTYYAKFNDIAGLLPGTMVSMKGTTIGKVTSIDFINENKEILVAFTVSSKLEFSKNSVAELFSASPLGGMSLQIVQVYDGAVFAKNKDTLPTRRKAGLVERLDPLQQNLDGVLGNADSLLVNVNSLLTKETKQDLNQTIKDLNTLIANFNQVTVRVNSLLAANQDKLDSSFKNLDKITQDFSKVSTQLSEADLSKTMKGFGESVEKLNALLSNIEKGEGSLGKLASDEAMYENLTEATKQLELLLQDFRLNPKRYVNVSVFGKKQKAYELPENDPAENNK